MGWLDKNLAKVCVVALRCAEM